MDKLEELRIEALAMPEPMLDELLDFARFLRSKAARAGIETAVASESVLGRDWLRPEEDTAWRDL
ncbi:MAG: DUF2281 domain-containing protein [Planctomycetes bacterium]|nr:DUF2281 domain-containing protein [Planctomycetota bacterium]